MAPSDTAAVEEKKVVVEEIDEDVPPLEEVPEAPEDAQAGDNDKEDGEGGKGKQTRSEKKSRKAIQKLGMKPFPGIVRVTVKKAKNILFVIAKPDVYKSPGSETYVVFGEAKIEDMSSTALTNKAKQVLADDAPAAVPASDEAAKPEEKPAAAADAAADDGEQVDETGVEQKDIELVMTQTSVTRAQAVKALKKNEGDIVNAIMELTM
mmetsp:Transcript_52748/g.132688  ORF Transcript_52748/g.132688 Transcript_52748/m.132688 type:complete len:208 (+) Transcript_52748:73-696(+)